MVKTIRWVSVALHVENGAVLGKQRHGRSKWGTARAQLAHGPIYFTQASVFTANGSVYQPQAAMCTQGTAPLFSVYYELLVRSRQW